MRITSNQVMRSMLNVINDRYADLAQLQEQMSSGKRLLRPSDNPVDVANDIKLKTKITQLSQYKNNIEDGLAYMNVTETAMNSTNSLLHRLRELSLQGASDTLSSTERIYLNKEVEQLTRQFIALVNTQYKGDYIFGGTETKIPPLAIAESRGEKIEDYNTLSMAYFDGSTVVVPGSVQIFNGFDGSAIQNIIPGSFALSAGGTSYVEGTDYTIDYPNGTINLIHPALAADVSPGTANYAVGQFNIRFDSISKGKDVYGSTVSNRGEILRAIEPGITMQTNITGDEFMVNVKDGTTMVNSLVQFGADLLANNQPGIESAINRIDSLFKVTLAAQSKNGARINRFETTLSRNEAQHTNTTEMQANIEDADMAQTVADYMNTQNVYNAALKSAAGVIQQSLVNFL